MTISLERAAELLGKMPQPDGPPFSNDQHLQAAQVLRALLIECQIYPAEQHSIGMTLAKINLP